MKEALILAKQAYDLGEVPIGAVITKDKNVIAKAHNKVRHFNDPIGHAEIIAISKAAHMIGASHLDGCDIFITVEPCPMCAAAISIARIKNIYFGAYDLKSGGITGAGNVLNFSSCHHKPQWYGGILESECKDLMQQFFKNLRQA